MIKGGDKMSNTVSVQSVLNMRYTKTDHWRRKQSVARTWDAVVLMTEGEIEYCFLEKTVTARAGDLFLLPGNLPYSGICHSKQAAFFVVDFLCTEEDMIAQFGAPCILARNTSPTIYSAFSEMLALWERQPIELDLRIKSFLYRMLCMQYETRETTQSVTPTEEILTYIIEHLGDTELSVTHLCKHFFISESQLRRNLLRATGYRPNEYITRLRLSLAKNQLLDSALRTKEIAERCGFASPYYFSRCFSEAYGLSPREFRAQYQETSS